MEPSQQFHLKWNNHSLNTLSSFQQLLDTNTLVDVSLTCSNGKTVTAHRMVLAACSEYFYQLFKELPEKHPVIIFKDANEDIVRDLLLFMYKGEVEVQESNLNDFLKFADTLQVKGLSQSDREQQRHAISAVPCSTATSASATSSPIKVESIKNNNNNINVSGLPVIPPMSQHQLPYGLPDMTKSYLAGLAGKFPPLFPLPNEPTSPATDLLTHLSSPNLYRALHHTRKYGNQQQQQLGSKFDAHDSNASVLKNMQFLNFKKMFGGDSVMAQAATDLASLYPPPQQHQQQQLLARDDNDNDSLPERPSSPVVNPPAAHQASNPNNSSQIDENGGGDNNNMDSSDCYTTPPTITDVTNRQELNSSNSTPGLPSGDNRDRTGNESDSSSTTPSSRRGMNKQQAAGRGSRLERMIAAEYKIMSEYAEQQSQDLPQMTPELMKSRRTHSLQLAIGEILHNRASVQSAATKYHIPRETLRRHYQRYLKAMGIQRAPGTAAGGPPGGEREGSNSNSSTNVRPSGLASSTNNNSAKQPPMSMDMTTSSSADESSNGFSSLMDIGQAYGIFNPDFDSAEFKSKMNSDAMRRAAASVAMAQAAAMANAGREPKIEEKDKDLVIDEDEDNNDHQEEEEEDIDVDKHEEDEEEARDEKKNDAESLTNPQVEVTKKPAAASTVA